MTKNFNPLMVEESMLATIRYMKRSLQEVQILHQYDRSQKNLVWILLYSLYSPFTYLFEFTAMSHHACEENLVLEQLSFMCVATSLFFTMYITIIISITIAITSKRQSKSAMQYKTIQIIQYKTIFHHVYNHNHKYNHCHNI